MNERVDIRRVMTLLLGLLLLGGPGGAVAQGKSPKRGLAYGYHSAADMQALAPGMSWWYNWASQPDAGAATVYAALGVEYVPMQWGAALNGGPVTANQLAANIPAGARYLLGFNEPNFLSQARLTPTQAAAIWPVLEDVARRRGLALVSPAVNYCGSCVSENGVTYYTPTQYLDAFFAACPGCRVDYIAVHTYVCEERWLRDKIGELKRYNKPIWLTEFACGDLPAGQITLAAQQKYMQDAVNYLEKEPAVFRYAWFSGRNNQIPFIDLLGGSGQLTALGLEYVHLPVNGEPGRLTPVAATASSTENAGTAAARAIDNDINSRWASDWADPQWLQLDFGSPQTFTRVQLSWEAAFARDYELQTSYDGQSWTTFYPVTGSDGGVDNITGLNAAGRYLRLRGTRRATTYGYSLYEIEVFGPTAAPTANTAPRPAVQQLRLYPNPATDELRLAVPPDLRAQPVTIVDGLGRVLRRAASAGAVLDVRTLPAGLYTVQLTTPDGRLLAQRLVKY